MRQRRSRWRGRVVTFVFSNPRHHLEMMLPVMGALRRRGIPVRLVSLAELRGFATPPLDARLPGIAVARVLPRLRRDPALGADGGGGAGGARAGLRRAARRLAWTAVLAPRLRWLLRDSAAVVVPNDAAFPYGPLAATLRRRGTPFVLVQEGLRFPTPRERGAAEEPYGMGGATRLCVWGEAAAEHFRAIGVPAERIVITGTPRYDAVAPESWREAGDALRARLHLDAAPLLYLSNPIDDLGLCSTRDKLALFSRFVRGALPIVARHGRTIVAKLHPREDVAAFRAAAAAAGAGELPVLRDEPLFAVLAAAHAAVVTASTTGLEALVFGLPLAELAIPDAPPALDYVSSGAALRVTADDPAPVVEALLAGPRVPRPAVAAFVERHLAYRGAATERVADCVAAVTTARRARADR